MILFNTLTKKKEHFETITPSEVKIYACGPTVYDYFHIGNARPFIVFDVLRNYLEYKGYKVDFVQNFTDIDDKMIDRANIEGITVFELAERFIEEYYKDADALGIRRATFHPRATEHIQQMIKFVEKLVNNGLAYQSGDDVYFNVSAFSGYGKLSWQKLDELNLGSRVDVNQNKRNPSDFVLWKGRKPKEPYWDSPWGEGRPGWHLECSVMATEYLGETIDIHAGGQDLVFPHHENEIAQSEGASGKPFAKYWLHNGYISIEDKKMSKSLGNFFTVRDVLNEFEPEVIRFFLLSAHYRNPINFSKKLLEQAKAGLVRLYNAKRNLAHFISASSSENTELNQTFKTDIDLQKKKFEDAMEDDLNTAEAIATLFEVTRLSNTMLKDNASSNAAIYAYNCLNDLSGILGMLKGQTKLADNNILQLIGKREQARKDKDWALSDVIRNDLKKLGVVIEDTKQGSRWWFDYSELETDA